MINNGLQKFKDACEKMCYNLPGPLSWEWEDRFGVVLTVFDKDNMDAVLTAVSGHFDSQWDSSSIGEAGDRIGTLVQQMFGMQPGQLLFSSDDSSGLVLFAAWWPWGNGVSISLRVGLFPAGELSEEGTDTASLIKEWFGQ